LGEKRDGKLTHAFNPTSKTSYITQETSP